MEKNILIIEDDKDIREGVKILLEHCDKPKESNISCKD